MDVSMNTYVAPSLAVKHADESMQWDSNEKIPTDKCYKLNTTLSA